MFESDSQKIGGVYKIPSGRPSIHSHLGCPFSTEGNMGGYGLDERVGSTSREGIDVVDHVQSKMAHAIGSPSRRKLNITKRNSMELGSKEYTEDDTDVLSKSLPATLPSQLYSRDDSDDEIPPRNEHETSKQSYNSFGTPNRSNFDRSTSYSTPSPNHESARSFTHYNEQGNKSNNYLLYIIGTVGILLAAYAQMPNMFDTSTTNRYDQFKFYNDISGLGEKYNVDENSILQVQSGISTIFEKQDTGSFIFVYNSYSTNFSPSDFNKFIDDISFAAAKYLRNESTPVHYTTVEGTKLDMDEHGELISRYRQDLDRTGVMLVRHVDSVPSELAMAFHYYCDEYNPLVKKSAVFFTLNLAKCPPESDKKSIHALIEKCLAQKWNSIPRDSIGPLLTRVVSVVIDVTSAF